MPTSWDDSLDTPTTFDGCPSFAGGQNSFAKPRMLGPDEAALLQDCEVAITGEAATRRGTLQLGGLVGSGTKIRGVGYYNTPSNFYDVAAAGTGDGVYKLNGAVWQQLGSQNFAGSAQVSLVQGNSLLYAASDTDIHKWNGSSWTNTSGDGDNAAPRNARYLIWHFGRLVAAGPNIKTTSAGSIQPDAIYFGGVLSDTAWSKSTRQIQVGNGDGVPITGIINWQNFDIAVFKRHSAWVVVADPTLDDDANFSVANYPIQLVHGTIGCIAPQSIAQVGADVFFLADDGVRSLASVAASDQRHELSDALSYPYVHDIIERINWSVADQAAATYWRNRYILSLPLDSSTTNNTLLVYNTVRKKWDGVWTNIPAANFAIRESSGISRLMMGLSNSNKVIEYLDYVHDSDAVDSTFQDYDGDQIVPHITTRAITFGEPVSPKLGMGMEIEWKSSRGGADIELIYDGDPKDTHTLTFDSTVGFTLPFTTPFYIANRGLGRELLDLMHHGEFRELQFAITGTGAGRKELRQIGATAFVRPTTIGHS